PADKATRQTCRRVSYEAAWRPKTLTPLSRRCIPLPPLATLPLGPSGLAFLFLARASPCTACFLRAYRGRLTHSEAEAHVEAGHRGRRRKADGRAVDARRVHDRAQGREHDPAHRAQRVARARAADQEEAER